VIADDFDSQAKTLFPLELENSDNWSLVKSSDPDSEESGRVSLCLASVQMLRESLRHPHQLSLIGKNRCNALPGNVASGGIGNHFQAPASKALRDLAFEVPAKLRVERDLGVGQDQSLSFIIGLRHVVNDERLKIE
jgi:hypothetical protein